MRALRTLQIIAVVLAFAAVPLVGCSKKAVQAPPEPAAAPPQPVVTPPAPTPPAPPPPPPALTSENFTPALFAFDEWTLSSAARQTLDANAKLLRDNANVTLTIEGHCDERGTVEYNLALGQRRAEAARDYLIAAGIAGDRLHTVSYGKERPFDSGHGEPAWAKNRRAHFVVR